MGLGFVSFDNGKNKVPERHTSHKITDHSSVKFSLANVKWQADAILKKAGKNLKRNNEKRKEIEMRKSVKFDQELEIHLASSSPNANREDKLIGNHEVG
jgi:hypothetical protein